jgi:hypothetical protein
LSKQIHRGGAEEQEAPGTVTAPAALINQATQFLEQLRNTVYLIENHQTILIGLEKQNRIGKLAAVGARFQIEIQSIAILADLKGKRGLSHLPWSDQGYRSLTGKGLFDQFVGASRNHPCNL